MWIFFFSFFPDMGQFKLVTFVVISAVAALVGGTSDAEPDPQVLVRNAIKLIRLVNDPTAIHFSLVQYFRLEPEKAIGTNRALPRLPSTRLGCHVLYKLYYLYILYLVN